jgi:hypothetical protein
MAATDGCWASAAGLNAINAAATTAGMTVFLTTSMMLIEHSI